MDRRKLISVAGATLLAGCGSNTGNGGSTPQDTSTPEPAEFEVISTTGGTYTTGESWPLEFTVANRGGSDGVFESQLQLSPSGSDWEDVMEISLAVDAGESSRFYQQVDPIDSAGTVSFRLQGTEAQWSITFERPESEFQGPSDEDRTYVDLQYRDYLEYEVEEIKSEASETSYEDVFRNADDRRGDAVHFTGTVAQNIPYETYDVYLIFTGNSYSEPIYASYVGDKFIQGDEVELWGQILGTEIYQSGAGGTNTVPGIAIAEMVITD
jgi:hypothetical protein